MQDVTVLIGTKRGLFVAQSGRNRREWTLSEPRLEGREILYAAFDPRTGIAWAGSAHRVWGAHVHRSDDGGETWETLEDAPHHPDGRGVLAIWQVAPGNPDRPDELFAGIAPAGLFRSTDAGRSWEPVGSLNAHPTTAAWQPAGGSLSLHSIHVGPGDRIVCAVSAGGAYRSDDGGANWTSINRGVRADFLPSTVEGTGHCVHRLIAHSVRPDRLWQQNHCGVYRSDDAGESWLDVSAGLPSEFGYALATDPADPDVAFVVPEASSHMRTVVDGRLRVYRTRDAGRSWEPLSRGLPQQHAWQSVLREGLASDGLDPLGLYLGTSGGHVFTSVDGGDTWSAIALYLPRVLSISAYARG